MVKFMLNYKPFVFEDKQLIDEIVSKSGVQSSDYPFVNNFLWKDFLLLKRIDSDEFFSVYSQKKQSYLFPILNKDNENNSNKLLKIINVLKNEAYNKNINFKFYGLTSNMKNKLEEVMPGKFAYTLVSSSSDYIYNIEDLINLKGKKYHSKRNFVNNFKLNYFNWEYKKLDKIMLQECLKIDESWLEYKNDENELLNYEAKMINLALEYFEELGLFGGAILVNGKIIGFSLGYKINDNIMDNVIEKALIEYKGVYSILLQQFLSHLEENFKYVNREEDLGLENLRKAKLSLHPCSILEKYEAVLL